MLELLLYSNCSQNFRKIFAAGSNSLLLWPDQPYRINVSFAGSFKRYDDGDTNSEWIEANPMYHSTAAINKQLLLFAIHGLPKTVVTEISYT